jgi:hypothetical protein
LIVPTISAGDPKFLRAIQSCVQTLRRLAEYELPAALNQRLQQLGEQKEFLDPAAHQDLLALVAFSQQRTLEKLEAQVALKRLREVFPELVDAA